MNQTETVAVVMCTYNGASRHLAEQLDSLFAQTLKPKEIIVQDDYSTDNTMELLADYARRAPDGVQMRVYQNAQQQGINRNFFSAMSAIRTTSGCRRSSKSSAPPSVRT